MTENKRKSLAVHKAKLLEKIADKNVPAKHVDHPETYRQHLQRELEVVNSTLDKAKV